MFGKQQIGAISWSRVCSSARTVPESTSEPVEAETFQFLWATPQSRNSELTAITVQTDCYQNEQLLYSSQSHVVRTKTSIKQTVVISCSRLSEQVKHFRENHKQTELFFGRRGASTSGSLKKINKHEISQPPAHQQKVWRFHHRWHV